jgi:Fic family protein
VDPERFRHSPTGRVLKTPQGYWAFVPNPIPRELPIDGTTLRLLSEADQALGVLAGTGLQLPNPYLLISPYMRREAVLSSQIEGTQASLSDLFFFEAAPRERPQTEDVREVFNYVQALGYGLKRLPHIPLSLRLVREVHERLMYRARGEGATSGEFRRSQNWIGPPGCTLNEATFVPPPAPEMRDALNGWEAYLQEREVAPPLVQCAMIHCQFETIHPFLDGNGRIGRLRWTHSVGQGRGQNKRGSRCASVGYHVCPR